MKKNSAYILYDPLTVTLTLQEIGGSVSQTASGVSGVLLYEPDRQYTPLIIQPRINVSDPDKVLTDGDQTASLKDCRWYLGSNDEGELITSLTSGYTLGDCGLLTVSKNIMADSPQPLYFTAKYVDPRTESIFRVSGMLTLTTTQSNEVNLHLQTSWSTAVAINALKNLAKRTLTVELYNGETKIADEHAIFSWLIFDKSLGTTGEYREIGEDDPCYVSGQGTSALTIDRRFIGKELLMVRAALATYPNITVKAHCKTYRTYGQWEASKPLFARGQYIRASTSFVEVEESVTTPKGVVADAEEYFDIEHVMLDTNGGQITIGYGSKAIVPGYTVRALGTRTPTFGVNVMTRSELRPITLGGKLITADGCVLATSVPEE